MSQRYALLCHFTSRLLLTTKSAITLEEIETATGFAQNIDKIELPNQLVAVLADPLLQKFLLIRPSEQSYHRVTNWLGSVMQEVVDGDTDEATLWEVLEVLRDFVVQTKVCRSCPLSPAFEDFQLIWYHRLYRLWPSISSLSSSRCGVASDRERLSLTF